MHSIYRTWLGLIGLLTCFGVCAGDLSTDVRQAANGPSNADGGYLELGIGAGTVRSPFYGFPGGNTDYDYMTGLLLTLGGRYQYKRFFVETFSESLEELTFGINLANGSDWALDFVGVQQHDEISEKESNDLDGLSRRHSDFTMGLRATGYLEPYIVQFHGVTDVSGFHDGQVISLKLARYWLYKNWNFHGILGATYRTEKVADYYLSVTAAQATDVFYQFDAKGGTTYVAELGATYPIDEHWVFRTFTRRTKMVDQWLGSPLVIGKYEDVLLVSMNYVF